MTEQKTLTQHEIPHKKPTPYQTAKQPEIYTVEQLNNKIKNIMSNTTELHNIHVIGEISNLTIHASKHTYFTIKDNQSQIKCILFAFNNNLKFELKHAMKVIVTGTIEIYKPKGEYSLIATQVKPDGIGELNLAFEQLKNKLQKKGLLDPQHKKELPQYPQTLAIITSRTSAALQDVLNIIQRRYPILKITIIDTIMQGEQAEKSILNALNIATHLQPNIVLLTRGGGSTEDLWCFNSEKIANAIFNLNVPIISGIGHEIDITITDLIADKRAPTPSAAAEQITPNKDDIIKALNNYHKNIQKTTQQQIQYHTLIIEQIKTHQFIKNPLSKVKEYTQTLDNLEYKIKQLTTINLHNKKQVLDATQSTIQVLNPLRPLKQGYSITTKSNKIIKNTNQLKVNDEIRIQLNSGTLKARITELK